MTGTHRVWAAANKVILDVAKVKGESGAIGVCGVLRARFILRSATENGRPALPRCASEFSETSPVSPGFRKLFSRPKGMSPDLGKEFSGGSPGCLPSRQESSGV
jgi:hypothetical protein